MKYSTNSSIVEKRKGIVESVVHCRNWRRQLDLMPLIFISMNMSATTWRAHSRDGMQFCIQIVVRWVSTVGVANRVISNFRSLFESDQNYLSQKLCKTLPSHDGLIREADFVKTILVAKKCCCKGRATNLFPEAWTTNLFQ